MKTKQIIIAIVAVATIAAMTAAIVMGFNDNSLNDAGFVSNVSLALSSDKNGIRDETKNVNKIEVSKITRSKKPSFNSIDAQSNKIKSVNVSLPSFSIPNMEDKTVIDGKTDRTMTSIPPKREEKMIQCPALAPGLWKKNTYRKFWDSALKKERCFKALGNCNSSGWGCAGEAKNQSFSWKYTEIFHCSDGKNFCV